jgi:hypothetical protein
MFISALEQRDSRSISLGFSIDMTIEKTSRHKLAPRELLSDKSRFPSISPLILRRLLLPIRTDTLVWLLTVISGWMNCRLCYFSNGSVADLGLTLLDDGQDRCLPEARKVCFFVCPRISSGLKTRSHYFRDCDFNQPSLLKITKPSSSKF